MKRRLLIWVFSLYAAASLCAQSNAPVRLGIIVEGAGADVAADLLTVELSKRSDIQLLERSEIEKVYREQGLSARNKDYLKLGQILSADGLLILQLSSEGGSRRLGVRLIAVKPGVMLSQHEYPWPLDKQSEWAPVVASQFQPLFGKLTVFKKDAVSLSILNLRSAVSSRQEETIERELTELLYARLVDEKDLFVLERRRMELMTREAEFASPGETPFWNGSYLIEGVIDKDGYNKDTVTVDIRLTPPDKKGVVLIESAGARTNLISIINDVTAKILAALHKQGQVADWNREAEADRYFSEGQWLFRWGMFAAAKSASEAAWALGKKTAEVAELKIKAYSAAAGSPGICMVITADKRVVFAQQINLNVKHFGQINTYASSAQPEQFADLVHAGELFAEAFHRLEDSGRATNSAWMKLGDQTLGQTSLWLRYYYFTVEARPGQEARIERARSLCREIARMLDKHTDALSPEFRQSFRNTKALHAAFWVDTPEQSLPIYRALLESGEWPSVRHRFFNGAYAEVSADRAIHGYSRSEGMEGLPTGFNMEPQSAWANPASPCVTGWQWPDRVRCPAIWTGFIDELYRSSKPLISLEGRILRCSYAWSEEEFEQDLRELLNYVQAQENAIVSENLNKELHKDIEALIKARRESLADERRSRIESQIQVDFDRVFAKMSKQSGNAQDQEERRAALQKKTDYLNSQTNFDFMSFAPTMLNGEYRADEAQALLPILSNYEARIKQPPPEASNRVAAMRHRRSQSSFWISNLQYKLTSAISPPSQTNQARARPPSLPMAAKPTVSRLSGEDSIVATHTLNIRHFWSIPKPPDIEAVEFGDGTHRELFRGNNYTPKAMACRYAEGRLWVEVGYDMAMESGRADFFGINLNNWEIQKVSFAGEGFSLTSNFEVHDGYLYLGLRNGVQRYWFKNKAWEQFTVPASGSTPVRRGDRLFFTSPSSILEYVADGSFRTLASNRRRPAVNVLDEIENLGPPYLFFPKGGALHALIKNRIYVYGENTHNWTQDAEIPSPASGELCPLDGGFLMGVGGSRGEIWGMFDAMAKPEFLFEQASPTYIRRPSPGPTTAKPHWRADLPSAKCWGHGDCIWFLTDSSDVIRRTASSWSGKVPATNMSMIRFAYEASDPIQFPVQFFTPDALVPFSPTLDAPWSVSWTFVSTPEGLVVFSKSAPGFWLVSPRDLQTMVADVLSQRDARRKAQQETMRILHEGWRNELWTTFDRNHNGAFESEEREEMIADRHYLELELAAIDAHPNGLLDREELRFFDVNNNSVLDPNEQKAIEETIVLLSDKLLARQTKSGMTNLADLPKELQAGNPFAGERPAGFSSVSSYDSQNMDGKKLEALMRTYLFRSFREGPTVPIPMSVPGQPMDASKLLKFRIENYWNSLRTNPPATTTP